MFAGLSNYEKLRETRLEGSIVRLLLVFALALVLVATADPTLAAESWQSSFRKCDLSRSFARGEFIAAEDGSAVFVTITPEDIPAIEEGLRVLKKCRKFWACVNERYVGRRRHCRLPR
jgi:hypothetical protein